MTEEEAKRRGLVITHFVDENEKWAHRRRPELYAYDYCWFEKLSKEERHFYGFIIDTKEE